MSDTLQRFIFDHTDIRGELVRLEQSYRDALTKHNYTPPVAKLLGDFLSAAALLSATLKFEGTLTLQARSQGEIPLIMAETTHDHTLRAIARDAENATSTDFHTLLKGGQLAITIDPTKGQRYQGIVPLEGSNLAECLEHYFQQSEQLSTRVWLASNEDCTTGMMLQELPASQSIDSEQRQEQWQHITHLANTLTTQEMLDLDFNTLLHRLYHQEQVRLFDPHTLSFQCSCSQQRTAKAIKALGRSEAEAVIAEQGNISIVCEFCHHQYHFNAATVAAIFEPPMH